MTPSSSFRIPAVRRLSLLSCALGMVAFLGACGSETGSSEPEDTVSFRSVTWAGELRGGDTVDFRVVLDWDLRSADSGEIDLGFNDLDKPSFYRLIDSSTSVVARGTGSREIAVRTVVKDWGSTSDFRIHATLSDHPHGQSWSPLATTERTLIPKK